MTLDELLHVSDLRVMGCVVPQWGVGTCGGRAVGEQAHGRTCWAWALRNESSLFAHLSAAAQRSLPEGGGGAVWSCALSVPGGSREASIPSPPMTLDSSLIPLGLSILIWKMGVWSSWCLKSPSVLACPQVR